MSWVKRTILIVTFALVGQYLVERWRVPWLLYQHDPSRFRSNVSFTNYKVLFENNVRNCEDVILDEVKGLAYVSCDPGRDRWNTVMGNFRDADYDRGWIHVYDYKVSKPLSVETVEAVTITDWDWKKGLGFHPLGLALDAASRTMYVVNHEKHGPAIEIFGVSADGMTLEHRETFKHPGLYAPNSIAVLGNGELYVTNDHRFPARKYGKLAEVETMAAFPGGNVNYVNVKTKVVKNLYNLPFANGIGLLNDTHVAVSSTTLPAVYVFTKIDGGPALKLQQKLRTNFLPDNLHVDKNGKLLIAGHPNGFTLQNVARENYKYDIGENPMMPQDDLKLLPAKDRPRAPSYVAEWDGNREGRLTDIYVGKGYGTSTSAVRDVKRGIGIISGLYEKGLLVWKE